VDLLPSFVPSFAYLVALGFVFDARYWKIFHRVRRAPITGGR
jgi:hypothetical protein